MADKMIRHLRRVVLLAALALFFRTEARALTLFPDFKKDCWDGTASDCMNWFGGDLNLLQKKDRVGDAHQAPDVAQCPPRDKACLKGKALEWFRRMDAILAAPVSDPTTLDDLAGAYRRNLQVLQSFAYDENHQEMSDEAAKAGVPLEDYLKSGDRLWDALVARMAQSKISELSPEELAWLQLKYSNRYWDQLILLHVSVAPARVQESYLAFVKAADQKLGFENLAKRATTPDRSH